MRSLKGTQPLKGVGRRDNIRARACSIYAVQDNVATQHKKALRVTKSHELGGGGPGAAQEARQSVAATDLHRLPVRSWQPEVMDPDSAH